MSKDRRKDITMAMRAARKVPRPQGYTRTTWITDQEVLVALCRHVPIIYPSVVTIAAEADLPVRTTQRSLARLEAAGLIVKHQRGYNRSNVYTLTFHTPVPALTPSGLGQSGGLTPNRQSGGLGTAKVAYPGRQSGGLKIVLPSVEEGKGGAPSEPNGNGGSPPPPKGTKPDPSKNTNEFRIRCLVCDGFMPPGAGTWAGRSKTGQASYVHTATCLSGSRDRHAEYAECAERQQERYAQEEAARRLRPPEPPRPLAPPEPPAPLTLERLEDMTPSEVKATAMDLGLEIEGLRVPAIIDMILSTL